MICHRCALSLRRSSPVPIPCSTSPISTRPLSTTRHILSLAEPNPALSSSAAQSFSTPFTQSASLQPPSSAKTKPKRDDALPRSSVKAGTVLRGLSYVKGQQQLVAKEDSEYPEWLWGLLDGKKGDKEGEEAEGDLFAKSKKQRRIAAKASRKQALNDPASLVPKIPLEHQSIDLPSAKPTADATGESQDQKAARLARDGLNSAMRKGRRKSIKEGNFLKSMR